MVDKIWMHIGAAKTGTTSLQYWLMNNRKALGDLGVLFPETPGKFNHIALAAYALEGTKGMEELRITCGANKYPSIGAFRQKFAYDLETEVDRKACKQLVFSNEHCSARLKSISEISRLRDFLHRFCNDVQIILYIREPIEFLSSWYSTMIASGGSSDFPYDPSDDLLNAVDWLKMVRMWASVFGDEAITLRRFDRSNLVAGDLVTDFCDILSLDPVGLENSGRMNESMGMKSILFLKQLNKTLPRIEDGHLNPKRGNIVDLLCAFPDDQKFNVWPETATKIRAQFAESYEELKCTYFPNETGPLFCEKNLHETKPVTLTENDYVAITRHLWINRPGV